MGRSDSECGGPGMNSRQVLVKLSHLIEAISLGAKKARCYATYCQVLAAPVNNLALLIDEIQASEVPIIGGAITSFEGLQGSLVKAKDLIERCEKETSLLYAAWHNEKTIHKFMQLAGEIGAHVSSLPLGALQLTDTTQKRAETCTLELHEAVFDKEVDDNLLKETDFALIELREGKKLGHERLANLGSKFHLRLNQEILREASLLERERERIRFERDKHEEDFVNQLISLVTQMGDDLAEQKQAQVEFGGIPVPADFRCPLSLELMSDPVIVASGQTYERSYIQQWLDQGNTTCPKTRQTLNHTNLIPNYTVKALIASWCETNSVPFPESSKLNGATMAATFFPPLKARVDDDGHMQDKQSKDASAVMISGNSQISNGKNGSLCLRLPDDHESRGQASNAFTRGNPRVFSSGSMNGTHMPKVSRNEKHSEGSSRGHSGNTSSSSSADDALFNAAFEENMVEVVSPRPHILSSRSSNSTSTERSPVLSSLGSMNQRGHAPSALLSMNRVLIPGLRRERCADFGRPRVSLVSNPTLDVGGDTYMQACVSQLVEDLQSSSVDIQRNAATSLRLLTKHSMDNRILIANCGAVKPLVTLLESTDVQTQENAVTALLNLSINDSNKNEIAAAGAIDPLINVLRMGSSEAKENSAATLFSLSVMDDNKVVIGQSGAILPLVDLLMHGTPRGKKDAATALFNLSILHENKARIVSYGAVRPLVELMADPAAGMVDKAVSVLANLATTTEGRAAIGEEGGIPALVEVVEMGSQRGKENAAAALLHLCTNNHRFRAMVLQEGAIPPLVALSQSGTARAKEKASALLRHFREQRQAILGRGGGPERHMDHRQFARPYG